MSDNFKDQRVVKHRSDLQKFSDFNGSWRQFIDYLHVNGALSPELERKYYPLQSRQS